jgi:hypothetical protein
MMHLRLTRLALTVLFAALVGVSCNRSASAPPAPLPLEQIPAALQKAFTKAKPENKALVDQLVATVQAQDYSKAFFQMQNLAAQPGLNKEQQSVTSSGVLTLNTLLQSAQTKGDVQATETLKTYRVNK